MQITWKRDTRQYDNAELAFAGKWHVASVSFDACRPTGSNEQYKIRIFLPGVNPKDNNWTREDAKATAEKIIEYWFKEAGF